MSSRFFHITVYLFVVVVFALTHLTPLQADSPDHTPPPPPGDVPNSPPGPPNDPNDSNDPNDLSDSNDPNDPNDPNDLNDPNDQNDSNALNDLNDPNNPNDPGNPGDPENPEDPEEEEEESPCDGVSGDPVNLFSGEFFLEYLYLQQKNALLPFFLRVHYSSFSNYNGSLGYAWTHNFNWRLYETDSGRLAVRRPDSSVTRYELLPEETMLYGSLNVNNEQIQVNNDGSYTLIKANQRRYIFDSSGKLTEIIDPRTGSLRLTYDAAGILPIVALPRYSHNTDPQVVVRDYRLLSIDEYLADGNATGRFFQFIYDSSGHLTTVIDQMGRQIVFAYHESGSGSLISITDAEGVIRSFTYYDDPDTAYYRLMETFSGQGCSECTLRRNVYSNSNNSRVTSQTQGVDNLGESIEFSYSNSYTTVTTTIRDTSTGDTVGTRSERADFILDVYGSPRVTKRIVQRGDSFNSQENYVTESVFDPQTGFLTTRILPNGSQVDYEYDSDSNLIKKTRKVTESVDHVAEYTYDEFNNQLSSMVYQTDRPNDAFVKERVYDSDHRLIQEKRKKGDNDFATISYEYYANGLLKIETDARGNAMQFEYTTTEDAPAPVGLLKRKFDPAAPAYQTTYTYDAAGNRKSITDALGHSYTYDYDAQGRLTKAVDPLGNETIYVFDNYKLIEVRSGNDTEGYRITRYAHNNFDQLTQTLRVNETDTEIPLVTHTYGSDGRILSETNALGQTTQNQYEPIGWTISTLSPFSETESSQVQYIYDKGGRLLEVIDPLGYRTTMEYDGLDRLISKTEVVGETEERTTQWDYNAAGQILQIRYINAEDVLQGTTYYYYDSLGRKIGINWDPATNIQLGDRALPERFEYDNNGNVTAQIDGNGNRTEFQYDAYNRRIRAIYADRNDYAGGNDLLFFYDLVDNPHYMIDGLGVYRCFHYDSLNRKTHESIPSSGVLPDNWWEDSTKVMLEYTYNAWNQELSESNLLGATTSTQYDRLGRSIQKMFPSGLVLSYVYNLLDQIIEVRYPPISGFIEGTKIQNTYNSYNANMLDSKTDRAGNTTSYDYNLRLELVSEKNSLNQGTNNVKTLSYDPFGRLSIETNELDESRSYVYDIFDQVIQVFHPGHIEGINESIELYSYNNFGQVLAHTGSGVVPLDYTYDSVGNRLTMVDGNDNTTTWVYDSRNRVSRKIFADTTFYEYTYDAMGNLKTRKDALDQVTQYTVNLSNQVTLIDYPNQADTVFSYDVIGRRVSMSDGSGVVTWQYDLANRITQYTQNNVNREILYQYNVESKRTQMEIRSIGQTTGWVTDYTYDNANRLVSLTDNQVSATPFQYTWHPKDNQVASTTLPSGAQHQRTYDPLGRISSIETLNASAVAINSFSYTYNKAGLREALTFADDNTINYSYDDQFQLSNANKVDALGAAVTDYDFAYAYDTIGNRQNATSPLGTTNYSANAVNAYTELTGALARTLTYDANGSLISDGVQSYSYNEENRLTTVTHAMGYTEFDYDSLGRRVEKREYVNSTLQSTERFLYDGNLVVQELDASNFPNRFYTRGLDFSHTGFQNKGGIGGLLALYENGQTSYYSTDAAGNITDLIDGNDNIVAHYEYDPFGNKLLATGPLADQPYQWSSRRYHAPSGLLCYIFREYSPLMGRWLTRDPIGEQGGANLYVFVLNNPVNLVDPLGLTVCVEIPGPGEGKSVFEKNFGPFKFSVDFQIGGGAKQCTKCCRSGPRRGQIVADREISLSISGSGTGTTPTPGGTIDLGDGDEISWWAGLRVSVSLGISGTGSIESDLCNNIRLQGKICGKGSGSLSISGGAEASLTQGWFSYTLGGRVTGTGTLYAEKCYVCSGGTCRWEPTKLCAQFEAKLVVSALKFNLDWTFYEVKNKSCR